MFPLLCLQLISRYGARQQTYVEDRARRLNTVTDSGKLEAKVIPEVPFSFLLPVPVPSIPFLFPSSCTLSLGASKNPSQQPCVLKISLFFSSSQLHKYACYSGKQRFCPWQFAVLRHAWYSLLQWGNCIHVLTERVPLIGN